MVALLGFFVATNRPLYAHVEYQGALDQLAAIVDRYGFGANDVLLFRGEGRDTPDLVVTPLKYTYGLDALAIRSDDPGKYAEESGALCAALAGAGSRRCTWCWGRMARSSCRGCGRSGLARSRCTCPSFSSCATKSHAACRTLCSTLWCTAWPHRPPRPRRPRLRWTISRAGARLLPSEQIDGQALAWTNGAALLRLPWPRDGKPHTLIVNLSPGATRPAGLGPAQACISYRPESSFELVDLPFMGEQCVTLNGTTMTGYRFMIDPRGQPSPATGTYLLRISSAAWVPAQADPAQIDQRSLGVQFGG